MSSSQTLSIADDLTIYHALDLKKTLLDALAGTSDLELNLSQVGEMDTAGLQLLILLKMEAQRAGKSVRIIAHSQAVSDLIDFCSLGARFGDPLIIPAHDAP
ncbi:MAG: Sulfate transporter/antisigma-factor antagonist [Proteobacteria bacterium]|nr:Sulfate transporter/antisigma-factor antagonist [Pseudomonadota bacterium]